MNNFWHMWRPFHTVHFEVPLQKGGALETVLKIEQMAVSMRSFQHRILYGRYHYEFQVVINGLDWFTFTTELEQGDTTR